MEGLKSEVDEEEASYFNKTSSQLLEEIYNLSRQLLHESGKERLQLAANFLNLSESVLLMNGSSAPLNTLPDVNNTSFGTNATDPFVLLSNGTFNNTRNNTSRGGGVQLENTEMDFGNDAAWILTATFIIFTMQSG
ncbi:hypothetical protein Pmani_032811 [Petrolisthes manimaculis]|uniref:Uncharacterized protein n=1 Tax=Petrolisthes manimaculis TaxID=1843537 RepID=A0AAE1NSW0_9EUCA|nr:hypothetical protein Pmani_032811 [Petrolisthes manimaculis]